MAKMSEIFASYYTLFRGQDVVPDTTDPEWTIALRFANTAIQTWARADATLWQELYTTAAQEGETVTLVAGTSQYDLPSNLRKMGSTIRIGGKHINLIGSQDALNLGANSSAAFLTGNPGLGYQLNINGYNNSFNGQAVDFAYYKSATKMTGPNSVPDMSDTNYMVQKMLALRSSNERNGFVFQTADRDATIALQNMILANNNPSDLNFLNDGTPGFGDNRGRGGFSW